MSLNIKIEQNRGYFNRFNAQNDINPTTGKAGVRVYQFKLWGVILAFFGWAVKLQNQDGKIHYVNKKSLEKWIQRHQGNIEGSLYEKIAESCKNQAVANCKKIWGLKISEKIKKAQEPIESWHKVFIQKLKDNQIAHIQARQNNHTFKIAMTDRTFIATQAKIEKSAYFKNLLTYNESKNRFASIKLDHALTPEMLNLLQKYLEGKDIREDVKVEDVNELYELHQTFDIAEILDILYEKIDFYSEELLNWNDEKELPAYIFWKKAAELYGDTRLARLCQEKTGHMDLIEQQLEKSELECTRAGKSHAIDYCKLHFFPTAPNTVALKAIVGDYYYQKPLDFVARLNPIKELVEERLGDIQLSSVTLDFQNIGTDCYWKADFQPMKWIEIFHQFMTNSTRFPCELIIQNPHIKLFKVDANFIELLKRLNIAYQKVNFKDIVCDNIDEANKLIRSLSFTASIKFDISCQPDSKVDDYSKQGSKTSKQNFMSQQSDDPDLSVTLYDLPADYYLGYYSSIKDSVTVSFSTDLQGQKRQWDLNNLGKLKVKTLTIENACLNQSFIDSLIFDRAHKFENLTELVHLTLKNCQMTPEQKEAIEKSIRERNRLKQPTEPQRTLTIID